MRRVMLLGGPHDGEPHEIDERLGDLLVLPVPRPAPWLTTSQAPRSIARTARYRRDPRLRTSDGCDVYRHEGGRW